MSSKKPTTELEQSLRASQNVNEYFESHNTELVNETTGQFLCKLIDQSGTGKSVLLKQLNLSKSFFYDILSDKKMPSRNNFLQVLITLRQPFEACQTALKRCGYSPLYARSRRDAIIIHCIENKKTLIETNIILQAKKMPLLY